MKKLCLPVLVLGLCAFFLSSCNKDKSSASAEISPDTNTEKASTNTKAKVVQTPDVDGIMIAGWYYSLSTDKDGKELMVAEYEARVGSDVTLYSDPNAELKVLTKKDVAVDNNTVRDFVKIHSYDYNRDFWVRDYAVVPYASAGMVRDENIFLYTKPDLGSIGTRIVDPYTIFAILDEEIEGDEDGRFYKIRYYINDGKTYTVNGYLLKNSVTKTVPKKWIQTKERLNAFIEENAADESKVDSVVIDELSEFCDWYYEDYEANR